MAFRSLGEARSLDLIIRDDSLCDRQYLRAHRRFLEMRRGRRESPVPSTDRGSRQVLPVREVPPPEPNEPKPDSPAPEKPETFEQSDKKQPNEPRNPLKTNIALKPNPANPTQTRVTFRPHIRRTKPRARRYCPKRNSRKRVPVRLFNMSRPINPSRPKPGLGETNHMPAKTRALALLLLVSLTRFAIPAAPTPNLRLPPVRPHSPTSPNKQPATASAPPPSTSTTRISPSARVSSTRRPASPSISSRCNPSRRPSPG